MAKTKHGLHGTRFYNIWVSAKQRATNPNAKDYRRYGAIGIGFSEEWLEFVNFAGDMKDSYDLHAQLNGEWNTQIDRIDNAKGYNKENCRWVTIRQNLNNRTNYKEVGTNGRKTNWGKHRGDGSDNQAA